VENFWLNFWKLLRFRATGKGLEFPEKLIAQKI
jgi:hypothetical protein